MTNATRHLSILAFIIIGLTVSACATVTTARLYNLETGEIINGTFENRWTGHGVITAVTAAGKHLSGEYTTISGANYSSGFGTAGVSGYSSYSWATAQGFSFNQPGKQFGSATLVGDGLVIDIVYVVDPWSSHGYGVGKDNKGGKWKVQF